MTRIVFGMNRSLDGYVGRQEYAPDLALFHHWIAHMVGMTGRLYGRRLYEAMRYFDEDACRLEPIANPFGKNLLPLSRE